MRRGEGGLSKSSARHWMRKAQGVCPALRDGADGQLAMDQVWKALFQSSTSPEDRGDENDQREVLKRVLLYLVVQFGALPAGPVFAEAIHICPDPSRHQQVDPKPAQIEPRDPKTQARIQSFIAEALKQGHGSDPVAALPQDVDGQDAIDESWNMLTSGNLPDEEREKIRRLCLKLVLGLSAIPAAMELPDVQYEESDLLGTGSFADVFRGRFQGTVVAVKRLREFTKMSDAQRQDMLKSLHREAFLWKLLEHPYILPLFGVSDAGQRERMLSLVSPLAENGGIRDYIRKLQSDGKLPESGPEFTKHICHLLHQISVGLVYLHGQGIVHGDLHCGNILINAAGDVQLTDFGLALIADATSYNYASVHGGGALFTRAPELLDPQAETTRQTTACDVYAFAFVCVELFTGQRAFPDDPEVQILGFILKGRRPERPHQLGNNPTHELMWSLIVACWVTLPEWRPKIDQLSSVMDKIVGYTNGKTPPVFASQEIWSLSPTTRYGSPSKYEPMITSSHDYLVHIYSRDTDIIDVHSVATGKVLHRFPGGASHVICTKRVMVTSSNRAIRIWSLVTGKCVQVFECDGPRGLSITNPEMLDAEDSDESDPAKTPQIVALLQWDGIAILTFPPSLHQLGSSEPKGVPAEKSPFFKYCLHHAFQNTLEDWCIATQENIAVVAHSSDLQVWDVVVGEKKWATSENGDSFGFAKVVSVSVDIRRGVVFALFGTNGQPGEISARILNVHTGENLHTLSASHLVHTRCQQSIPSLLSLTGDGSFTLWNPWSSPPIQPFFLPRIPPHHRREYPAFAHNHMYALWAGSHGVDVVNIHSGFTMGTLAIEGGSKVHRLYLRGQSCVAVLCTSSGVFKVVVSRFSTNGHASVGSEFEGFDWSVGKASLGSYH